MKLLAAFIALIVVGIAAMLVLAGLSFLFFGAANPRLGSGALHYSFFRIGSLAVFGAMIGAAVQGYKEPQSVFNALPLMAKRFSLSQLDRPIKRLMFLVCLGGMAIIGVDILLFMANDHGSFFGNFDDFFGEVPRRYTSYPVYRAFFWLGVFAAGVGFVSAYWFESTLGRLAGTAKRIGAWVQKP